MNGFAVCLLLALTVDLSATSYISLTRDGYQNVVVTIEEDSAFDNCVEGLDKVKELVRNTSTSFANALTGKLAYFGNVTIIVPDSWANDPSCSLLLTSTDVGALPWPRNHRADMRIIADHPVFSAQPYSFQYGGCRTPGLPINVPSSFIVSDNVLAKGKRMAREWAHYRYGVFDEGGMPDDPRHPSGYESFQTENADTVVRANTCSDSQTPSGKWNSDQCKSTADSSCEFVPDVYNNPNIQSSLMYRPDLDQMEKFCTKDNHDDGVPSKLSYYCGRLSASDVIYRHLDFTQTPSVTPANTSATISFNVIRNPFSGYHVIIDMASFSNNSFFQVAKRSLMQFVNFTMLPVHLSIDLYDGNDVSRFQEPITLDDNNIDAVMTNLTEHLDWSGSASSNNFDKALENAQLRANDGQDVIILTAIDSGATVTDLNKWITIYQDQKINVHIVYFGSATNKLIPIAPLARYGSLHFLPNFVTSQTTSQYVWGVNSMQSIHSRTKSNRAKISEQTIYKRNNTDLNKTGYFYLDSSTTKLLISLYYLNRDYDTEVDSFKLFLPNNGPEILPTNLKDREAFYSMAVQSVNGNLLQEGLWRFNMTLKERAKNAPMRLDIWAETANSSLVQLETWNNATDNSPIDFSKTPVGIYAQLTQKRKPVRGANVTAVVYASDSSDQSVLVSEIQLMDEGIADVTSGDGIYSGWMTRPSNSSLSYSVYYRAYGVNSLAQVDQGVYSRTPTTGSVIPMTNPVAVADQFNRFGYGPSFQLSALPSNSDSIPPQRVTDLSVVSYDPSDRMLVLSWSASKDNYGTGDYVTRYKYERVIGTDVFVSSPTQVTIVDGRVNMTFDVPAVNEGQHVTYRVWGVDSNNNVADASNGVSLAGPALSSGGLSAAAMWGLIGGGIAILLIILVIILVCCCCPVEARRKKRQAARKMRRLFKKEKKNDETAPVSRYQPPPVVWQSPTITTDGDTQRRYSDSSTDGQVRVEIRQKAADPSTASNRGSERIYFGQEDIDRMTNGPRSETYSERGMDEMVKRAPSMDLQLATILRMNDSNMTVDRVGLNEDVTQPTQPVKPRIYAKPNKPGSRPTSTGPLYNQPPNKPLSQSETNLYYTDVALRTNQSARSTPVNSYMNVYAEQPQQLSPRSSLAQTLRSGMQRNDEWRDSNSFIYTDPRFDTQSKSSSSFDPQLHPANQVGLPPSLPAGPPPLLPRSNTQDMRSSMESGLDQQQYPPEMQSRSSSKPSLV